jgi:hypothetical protein
VSDEFNGIERIEVATLRELVTMDSLDDDVRDDVRSGDDVEEHNHAYRDAVAG